LRSFAKQTVSARLCEADVIARLCEADVIARNEARSKPDEEPVWAWDCFPLRSSWSQWRKAYEAKPRNNAKRTKQSLAMTQSVRSNAS